MRRPRKRHVDSWRLRLKHQYSECVTRGWIGLGGGGGDGLYKGLKRIKGDKSGLMGFRLGIGRDEVDDLGQGTHV